MSNFDYTHADADFNAALWSELFKNMGNHSHYWAPQSTQTATSDLPNSNVPHETTSMPVTKSTEAFTDTRTNHTHPVSKEPLDH